MEDQESIDLQQLMELKVDLPDDDPQKEREKERGVRVEIREDYKHSLVNLKVGTQLVSLSISQTRELAIALRQSANLIERHNYDRGEKPKRRKRRRR